MYGNMKQNHVCSHMSRNRMPDLLKIGNIVAYCMTSTYSSLLYVYMNTKEGICDIEKKTFDKIQPKSYKTSLIKTILWKKKNTDINAFFPTVYANDISHMVMVGELIWEQCLDTACLNMSQNTFEVYSTWLYKCRQYI